MGSKSVTAQFLILSRNARLYATRRLREEFRRAGKAVRVVDPHEIVCISGSRRPIIYCRGRELLPPATVIPRVAQSGLDYTVLVARCLEFAGFRVINGSDSILRTKDKFRCLLELAAKGIPTVPSALIRSLKGIRDLRRNLGDLPFVIKTLRSMGGYGVTLAENQVALRSALQIVWQSWQDTVVQKYIKSMPPVDYRVIVAGGRALCSVMRTGRGDFRTNLHQGGSCAKAVLSSKVLGLAIRSASVMGLSLAAVDMVRSGQDYFILEVNSSPGFEGAEKFLHINVARKIVEYCVSLK